MTPRGYRRPEHANIVALLASMDADWLLANRCYFGGGTAIVLSLGEYRRSLDVDFLCDDGDGYRAIRGAVTERGVRALFGGEATSPREFRIDQYGVRGVVVWNQQAIKVEVIREARIALSGAIESHFAVPVLSFADQVAEKLLANADRGLDRAIGYRDAIDLGMLVGQAGSLPASAVAKATKAYGADIARKAERVLQVLSKSAEVRYAAATLDMDESAAFTALAAFRRAAAAAWPELSFAAVHDLDEPL